MTRLIPLLAAVSLAAGWPGAGQGATPACPDWLDPARVKASSAPLTCACDDRLRRHSAYGVFRYSILSHVCTAARHDGRIGLRGGTVTLYFGPGCRFYREAWRNSVQSRKRGASAVSFAFRRPLPPCTPKPKPRPRQRRPERPDVLDD